MDHFSKLIEAASLASGLGLALLGVVWLGIAASGALQVNEVASYAAGAGFLVVAAPLLAFPFRRRLAEGLGLLALILIAFFMVWQAFRPEQSLEHPALAQAGAIALVVLLTTRVGLAWYRRRAGRAS